MDAVKVVLTYQDYLALPNDGRRYEILGGELAVTPAPGRKHQRVLLELAIALDAHVKAHALGEVDVAPFDVILADTAIVQPDIIFVAGDRSSLFSDRGVEGAPTLAVEILSPYTKHIDRATKLQLYAKYRVPYYWIVDPDLRAIDVYQLASGAYGAPARHSGAGLVDLPPFPGLTLVAATLWP